MQKGNKMPSFIDTIGETLSNAVTSANPYNENLNKKRKTMIQVLIAAGNSKEEIIKFLYVSESNATKYIDKLYAKKIKESMNKTS